eukprot:SAG22_NODE_6084_length_902_cov_0.948941_3_plen_49_part_00
MTFTTNTVEIYVNGIQIHGNQLQANPITTIPGPGIASGGGGGGSQNSS